MRIRVFGKFEITIDDRALQSRTPKDFMVLAYLILKHDTKVDRTALAGLFWEKDWHEDKPVTSSALRYLSRSLSEVSSSLGEERWRLKKPTPQSVLFDTCDADLDLIEWETALERTSVAELECAAPPCHVSSLLAGWNFTWVEEAREQMGVRYMRTLQAAALRARDHGKWNDAVRCYELLFQIDPWYENFLLDWLNLLFERRLFSEMHRLYDRLFERNKKQERSIPTQIRERFLDLRNRAAEFKNTEENGRLPNPPSNFISRSRDISEIRRIVQSNRLTTLTGSGGVGKTRLAITAAEAMREEFYDRVWFADLGDVNDPTIVPMRVAQALRLRDCVEQSYISVICNSLRTQNTLLILDNCEHLLDSCAQLADQILQSCPEVKILATSREALGIIYEAVWRVPSLDFPDSSIDRAPECLTQFNAVRLLVERASRPQRPFVIDEQNAAAVAQICRCLDGIPLAIELAAVQIHRKFKSAQDVADSLDRSLQFLTEGSRTSPPRQQTVCAAIDWSYRLLSEAEQGVFELLGVFAGGFTDTAARVVCGDSQLLPDAVGGVVLSLADKSLVEIEPSDRGVRYHLLQTIRQFAIRQLEARAAPAARAARLRHLTYFASFAEKAAGYFAGPEQALWLDLLSVEQENLRTTLRFALDNDDIATGLPFAGNMAWFWYTRSHREGLHWLEEFLARASAEPRQARLQAIHWAGNIAYAQNDFPRAKTFHEEGLAIRIALNNPRDIAIGRASLANSLAGLGDYSRAQNEFEQSQILFREARDTRNVALVLTNLGGIAYALKNFRKSRVLHEESLCLFRECGDSANVALALHNLAGAAIMLGDFETTHGLLAECLVLCMNLGIRHRFVHCLTNYVSLFIHEGKFETAAVVFGFEEALRHRIGHDFAPNILEKYIADLAVVRERMEASRYRELVSRGATMTEEDLVTLLSEAVPPIPEIADGRNLRDL